MFSVEHLSAAWRVVEAQAAGDGAFTQSVNLFNHDIDRRLAELADQLNAGDYRPDRVVDVPVVVGDDSYVLHIASVRDRIVEKAVAEELATVIDPLLSPFNYAYRPGLTASDAVRMLAALRDEGYTWVLRAEIPDLLARIPCETAMRRLHDLPLSEDLVLLCEKLIGRYALAHSQDRQSGFLPQSSPLIPVASHLVVHTFDEAMAVAGCPMVRYGGEVMVAATSREEAAAALNQLSEETAALGLSVDQDTACVMSFADGFAFLGEECDAHHPSAIELESEDYPERKTLYVAHQGSRVQVSKGRIEVVCDDEELLSVPSQQVERLVLFGSVGLSSGAREWSMEGNADVVFASRKGAYQGCLVGGQWATKTTRLRSQLALEQTPQQIGIARRIVEAKVRHQIALLMRFGRRIDHELARGAVTAMKDLLAKLPHAKTVDELMGIEGAAARSYWPAYGALFPAELQFSLRSRRPPLDAVNAALGFLYAVLLGECVTALMAQGLDPGVGVLHATDDTRPSLALDLMEEFRPLIVDRAVLGAARAGRFTAEHAKQRDEDGGVWLNAEGRRMIMAEYEALMLTTTRGALPQFAGSWRRHLYRQAQRLCAGITTSDATLYGGMSWR